MKKLFTFISISLLHAALWAQTTYYSSGQGGDWTDPLTWRLAPGASSPAGPPSPADTVIIAHYVSHTVGGAYTQTGPVTIAAGGTYELISGQGGVDRYTFAGTRFEVRGTLLCTGDFAHQLAGTQGAGLLQWRAEALVYIGGDLLLEGHGGLWLDGTACGGAEIYGDVAFRGKGSYAYGPGYVIVGRSLRLWAGSEEVLGGNEIMTQLAARLSPETQFMAPVDACDSGRTLVQGAGAFAAATVWQAVAVTPLMTGNRLSWTLKSDLGHREYVVERAGGGSDFVAVGRVAANGDNWSGQTYSFWDSEKASGPVRYRLRLLRHDAYRHLSETLLVPGEGLWVYPNPANGPVVNLLAPGFAAGEPLTIVLRNALGQVVQEAKGVADLDGHCRYQLETAPLQSGTYLVSVQGRAQRLARSLRIN